jgi:hypothetical protein
MVYLVNLIGKYDSYYESKIEKTDHKVLLITLFFGESKRGIKL